MAAAGAGGSGAAADPAKALARLANEAKLVEKKPLAGVKFLPGSASSALSWIMTVEGPATYKIAGVDRPCPYAGRVFSISLQFPATYPFKLPDLSFTDTHLWHPNVAKDGEICLGELAKGGAHEWGPTKNILFLGEFIKSMLAEPSLKEPLNPDAAAQMMAGIETYESAARTAAAKAPKA